MKILVRGPNWLGDAIFARSFYSGLRAHYPDAKISLWSHPRALGIGEGEWFDEVIPFDTRNIPRGFDLGISLPASLSSAYYLWRAKIKTRVGFAELAAEVFLTTALRWKGRSSGLHKSALYLSLLELLTGKAYPLLNPEVKEARREKKILLGPGASLPLREWPYYLELCDLIAQRFPDYALEIVGAPTDQKWRFILRRAKHAKRWIDRIGDTSLAQLKETCSKASLVIANDSGLAHVAATLCGAPTLVLFGPGDPAYIAPAGSHVICVRDAELPCSPCESAVCIAPYGYQRCLRNISAEKVLELAAKALSL